MTAKASAACSLTSMPLYTIRISKVHGIVVCHSNCYFDDALKAEQERHRAAAVRSSREK
jgi:hypothetical protein